ncbi:MAG: bifunctional DNA-formamidopyrimidine glycosylase/DNA-(apurinic or apyrimidinic site) lyase [Planctomycetota bacterium]
MPELPEVETVVRAVRPHVVGRRIARARVAWPRTVGALGPEGFARRVRGLEIRAIHRRAKWFVMALPSKARPRQALLGHLRMSGRLEVQPAELPPLSWERAALLFTDGTSVRFIDVRKFGRLELVDDPDDHLADIGPEPLEPTFTDAAFTACLAGRRGGLKATLLDPRVVAGLGNIYVDEALHRAGLHPLRSVATLRAPERVRLRTAIVDVLAAALDAEGSSFDVFYRTPDGRPGSYQDRLLVYGRAGEPCTTCACPVRRIVVAGRGTHVCPRCQRAPRRATQRRRAAATPRPGGARGRSSR